MNQNNNEMSVVFVDGCFDWLRDMFLAGVDLCGVLILGAVAVGCFAYGLHAGGWL